MTTGRCLCGMVRFEVAEPLRGIVVCHCSLCRRSGTMAGAYTRAADRSALRISDPSSALAVHVDANGRERSFCGRCGSSLFWAAPGDPGISISAGALDGADLPVIAHIHVDSAAQWELISDDVPRHAAGRSSPLGGG